jgi:gamma-glutamylcyclotransferase
MPHVWYFAYGSNMHTVTFRGRRGLEFTRALAARVGGWRLVLDKPPLLPIGEGFANIVSDRAAEVLGVLYEMAAADLEHLDLTEGVLIGNYQRIDVPAAPLDPTLAPVRAFTLVSEARDPTLQPSHRYMAHLIAGAEEHGLPADYVAFLRTVPAREQSAEAAAFGPLIEEALRHPTAIRRKK